MTTTRPDRPTAPPARRPLPARAVAVVALTAGAVLAQMAFPLTDGGTAFLTTAAVVLLAAGALGHAAVVGGPRAAALLAVVAGGGGLLAEVVGVHTGVPFGGYSYSGTLGWSVLGVPVLVPLAWVMMAYPALATARFLLPGRSLPVVAPVAAWALAAWDVFLDPQMVDAGHWSWHDPEPSLPGVADVPLTNFAGWLVVSLLMVTLLARLLPRPPERAAATSPWFGRLPVLVYLWTYFSSVLAHAVFFGRPSVAVTGGLAMGVVAVPTAVRLARLVRGVRARP